MAVNGDIKLSVNLDTKSVKKESEKVGESISGIFKAASGKKVTSSFKRLLTTLGALDSRSKKLRADLKSLEGTAVPTDQFKALTSEIIKYSKQIERLQLKQKALRTELSQTKNPKDRDYIAKRIEKTEAKINSLRYVLGELNKEQRELERNGASIRGEDTEQYKQKTRQLNDVINRQRVILQQMDEYRQKQKKNLDLDIRKSILDAQAQKSKLRESSPKLASIVENIRDNSGVFTATTKTGAAIDRLKKQTKFFKRILEDVGFTGTNIANGIAKAFGSASGSLGSFLGKFGATEKAGAHLTGLAAKSGKLAGTLAKVLGPASAVAAAAITAFTVKLKINLKITKKLIKATAQLSKKIGRHLVENVKNLTKALGTRLLKHFKLLNKESKGAQINGKKLLRILLQYGFGIRSMFFLIRNLRGQVKEGLNNLRQFQDGLNDTSTAMLQLESSMLFLKNAWGAAFAPIINFVTPALTALIDKLAQASNAIAAFFASLTGQATYIKAVKVQKKLADGFKKTGKAAKEASNNLAAFDKIDVLNQDKDNDVGGAGENKIDPNEMFSLEKIPNNTQKLIDKIKAMWAEADFTDLGRTLGEKLKEALESIPWEEIKQKCYKIGKSIATFLNGFFETPGLATVLGKTIGEAINSALNLALGFVENFHFDSFGIFIAEGIRSAIETIDWKMFQDVIGKLARGIAESINAFFTHPGTMESIGKAIGQMIQGAIHFATEFIKTIKLGPICRGIADAITNALKQIKPEEIIEGCKALGQNIADGINGFFSQPELPQQLGEKIAAMINGAILGIKTFLDGTKFGEAGKSIGEALHTAIENIEWEEMGRNLAKGINKAIEFLIGLQSELPIEDVVTMLTDAIAGFLEEFDWEKNGKALGDTVKNLLQVILTKIKEFDWLKFGEDVGKFLKGLDIKQIKEDIKEIIWKIFQGAASGARKAWVESSQGPAEKFFRETASLLLTAFGSVLMAPIAVIRGCKHVSSVVKNTIREKLGISGDGGTSTVMEDTGKSVTDGLAEGIENNSANVETSMENLGTKIIESASNTTTETNNKWNDLKVNTEKSFDETKTKSSKQWTDINKDINKTVKDMNEAIDEKFTDLKEDLKKTTEETGENMKENFSEAQLNAITSFDDMRVSISDIFDNLFSKISEVCASIKSTVQSMVASVQAAVAAAQAGIASLEAAVSKQASLSAALSAGGGSGGGASSGSSSNFSVPHLAKGAVIPPNREFLAMLGDQKHGTNIEAPLDTIVEAFESVVGNMNVQNTGYSEMQLDGETFARLITPYVVSELERQDYSPVTVLEG